jgi:hypothetical protein
LALDTVYSLSGGLPPRDRGEDETSGATFQSGSLVIGSVRQVCLIRKISAGGALLHVDTPIEEGRRLELELSADQTLEGVVVWRRGSEVGLRFDTPIDILPILARNLVSQPGERRRMPRVEVFCPALLESGGRTELVTTRDIAQGGIKIDTPLPLTVEQEVTVTPEGLWPLRGTVRWVNGTVAGIAFQPELAWQELMPWLKARRVAPEPDFYVPPPETGPVPPIQSAEGSVQLNLPARVREGMRRWRIDVATLTTRTVEFESFAPLRLGTLLWIVLPGLEGWPARIVDNDGYRFICEFTQPLHPAVLERVLATARSAN